MKQTIHQYFSSRIRRLKNIRCLPDWRYIMLGIVIVIQGYLVTDGYALIWLKRVCRLAGHSALERSAVYASGNRFSEYMEFLREQIPPNGIAIITTGMVGGETGHEAIMEYYLHPREIINCASGRPVEECIPALTKGDTYVLAVGEFPPEKIMGEYKVFIPFDPDHFYRGVYIPAQSTSTKGD
jgi:hypothetical protein